MKRYLLTASLLILGGLNAFASSARAVETEVNVPFEGAVLAACAVVPLPTPGLLTVPSDNSKALSSAGNLAGTLTVLCNTPFSVTSGAPEETTLAVLPQFNADTGSSSIRSIESTLGGIVTSITGDDLVNLAANDLYTIQVDMVASKSTAIEAGAYAFQVPVTVTSD